MTQALDDQGKNARCRVALGLHRKLGDISAQTEAAVLEVCIFMRYGDLMSV